MRLQDKITSTGDPESAWPMLIIARASSFVLLVRLSKRRVLHLEVDEVNQSNQPFSRLCDQCFEQRFIIGKLQVIQTELLSHIQHVPRLVSRAIDGWGVADVGGAVTNTDRDARYAARTLYADETAVSL